MWQSNTTYNLMWIYEQTTITYLIPKKRTRFISTSPINSIYYAWKWVGTWKGGYYMECFINRWINWSVLWRKVSTHPLPSMLSHWGSLTTSRNLPKCHLKPSVNGWTSSTQNMNKTSSRWALNLIFLPLLIIYKSIQTCKMDDDLIDDTRVWKNKNINVFFWILNSWWFSTYINSNINIKGSIIYL